MASIWICCEYQLVLLKWRDYALNLRPKSGEDSSCQESIW